MKDLINIVLVILLFVFVFGVLNEFGKLNTLRSSLVGEEVYIQDVPHRIVDYSLIHQTYTLDNGLAVSIPYVVRLMKEKKEEGAFNSPTK